MWKVIGIIGFIGFLSGGIFAALGKNEIAIFLMPFCFILAVLGGGIPLLMKPIKKYEYGTGIGTKICVATFIIISVPACIDSLINDPVTNLGDILFSYGFPVFGFGIILNIYNMNKNGAFK